MTNGDTSISAVPSFPDFCLNTPLYLSFAFNQKDLSKLRDIYLYEGHLDCYCLECKQSSVFKSDVGSRFDEPPFSFFTNSKNIITEREFTCSREKTHKLIFYFRFHNRTVTKIGQNPSLADLATYDIRKYIKVLGQERYAEFSKAVGLISHGVGIGSFVYLRRIIEQLIEEAHKTKVNSTGWDEEKYKKCRTSEKIEMLKDSLPDVFVENKPVYPILSKGIHDLEEQECLDAFDVIRGCIELILDEKIEELQRNKKAKTVKEGISKLAKKIKET